MKKFLTLGVLLLAASLAMPAHGFAKMGKKHKKHGAATPATPAAPAK